MLPSTRSPGGGILRPPLFEEIDLNLVLPAKVSIQQHGEKTKAT